MLHGATLLLGTWLLSPSISVSTHPLAAADHIRIAQTWDDLSDDDKQRAIRNYRRYMELPPEKRKSIDERYEKWKRLPSSERERVRKKYQDYRSRGALGAVE